MFWLKLVCFFFFPATKIKIIDDDNVKNISFFNCDPISMALQSYGMLPKISETLKNMAG